MNYLTDDRHNAFPPPTPPANGYFFAQVSYVVLSLLISPKIPHNETASN